MRVYRRGGEKIEIFDGNKSSRKRRVKMSGKSKPRFSGLYRYSFLNRDPSILFPPLHQPNAPMSYNKKICLCIITRRASFDHSTTFFQMFRLIQGFFSYFLHFFLFSLSNKNYQFCEISRLKKRKENTSIDKFCIIRKSTKGEGILIEIKSIYWV